MTAIATACNRCRREFEPDRAAILAGIWRTCPDCRPPVAPPPDDPGSRCQSCGRPLWSTTRTLCVGCLLGGSPL